MNIFSVSGHDLIHDITESHLSFVGRDISNLEHLYFENLTNLISCLI